MQYPKDVEKVEKEVDLTTINEDSTQTIGESPKNILPPPEASVPYPSSSKTNNQESVQGAKATIVFFLLTCSITKIYGLKTDLTALTEKI